VEDRKRPSEFGLEPPIVLGTGIEVLYQDKTQEYFHVASQKAPPRLLSQCQHKVKRDHSIKLSLEGVHNYEKADIEAGTAPFRLRVI
jgi:hypothetical protein